VEPATGQRSQFGHEQPDIGLSRRRRSEGSVTVELAVKHNMTGNPGDRLPTRPMAIPRSAADTHTLHLLAAVDLRVACLSAALALSVLPEMMGWKRASRTERSRGGAAILAAGSAMSAAGNRRATECLSRSRLYAADMFHLIKAGVCGGKTGARIGLG
jgi:hypothetical protein